MTTYNDDVLVLEDEHTKTSRPSLSIAQQRLWLLDQLEPGASTYNLGSAILLNGQLDLPALELSFDEIVRRHESLRTTFVAEHGQPAQLIAPTANFTLAMTDLSQLTREEREAKVRRQVREEARRPFDLSTGPLMRASLLKLAEQEHVLLITMHHIISDGWSMGILFRELTALYQAYSSGAASPLPELSIQYADYAQWQRNWLQGEVLEQQLSYWKEQLDGVSVLELPTDRARPAVQSYRGATQSFTISRAVSDALKQLSRQEGVTLFMTLLAAFQLLLSRYSGQEDIAIGTDVANRNRAEIEQLIGFFVNTLVMRTEVRGEQTFRELLGKVRETCLGAYAHQDVPFEKLVEELQPERHLSHNPFFQVMFQLQAAPTGSLELAGLESQPLGLEESAIAGCDLALSIEQDPEALRSILKYNTDLFDAATISRMLSHFETLLASIVSNPHQRLSEFEMLGNAERQQMLIQWNQTETPFPSNVCIHQLFEAQVTRTPDSVALVFEDQQLTYRELNERANQLAHHLQTLGVGPEVLVGICMERSVEMVVSVLGTLKAGAAYLPLDPAYPSERLSFMLEDAAVRVLLTEQGLKASLPAHQAEVVCVDTDWRAISEQSVENPICHATSDNLAYVIYTSGSTGRPKGVLLPHRGVCNLAEAQIRAFNVQSDSRVLQFASFSFDASVSEMMMALLKGATLCLSSQNMLMAGPALLDALHSQAISVVTLPPTLLATMPAEEIPSLRSLVVAGEACSADLVAQWANGRQFFNAYGPTEVTVCATIATCFDGSRRPPIGNPMSNIQVYVLDRNLQPVPVGIPGELYVGGVGVGRGYLNHPGMTAERFIPNPFSYNAGARMYRTGDLVRYLPDGMIEFLGRIDQQVKINGHRIELGEIEEALSLHAGVRENTVIVREDAVNEKRLVAYIVPSRQPTPNVKELRSFLKERLPDYMVPAVFMTLEALPVNHNGKVDKRALPTPSRTRPILDNAYQEPRTNLEQMLAEMWQKLLGIEGISTNDNFFELGGDSIQAALLLNQLQEVLGECVYVVALFDAPTIAELTTYLCKHYAKAVTRVCGIESLEGGEVKAGKVNEEKLAYVRNLIKPLSPFPVKEGNAPAKNPRAIFVLSPPRSGSTLLRVMLAGNKALFAPPELQLLCFNTLAERKETFSGRYSFWLEGTIRAIMDIKGCGADEAKQIMEDCEAQQLSTQDFYLLMQQWLGERQLVDKTPAYAFDLETIKRAEDYFEDARYIHLLRHPNGMIRSFEDAKLDQIFRYDHPFSTRELAELLWLISHQNILEFLKDVPENRQHRVNFEELVKQPEAVMRDVCRFLDLDFDPAMAQPHKDKEKRMTDGIHGLSRMLGDIKFHTHQSIDAKIAERWKAQDTEDLLGDITRQVAESLGYENRARAKEEPARNAPPASASLIPMIPAPRRNRNITQVLAQLEQLSEEEARSLLNHKRNVSES